MIEWTDYRQKEWERKCNDSEFHDSLGGRSKMTLLLRFFTDVLQDSFKGKHFTYRIEPLSPVPQSSLMLWIKRGYEPSAAGIAFVKFDGVPREYTYPAYFWSE